MKAQTKKDKTDESVAMKDGKSCKVKQPMKDRRHESAGMKKAMKKAK